MEIIVNGEKTAIDAMSVLSFLQKIEIDRNGSPLN